MDMERKQFQWRPVDPPQPVAPAAPPPPETFWQKYRNYAPFVVFGLVLVVLFVTRKPQGAQAKAPEPLPSTDVLIALTPVAKGQRVHLETLRLIPIRSKDLTARQRIQAVRPEDLRKLEGQVRAKKTLAPQQILYWSDLNIASIESQEGPKRTRVILPVEEARP
jgi:hypothetical protein